MSFFSYMKELLFCIPSYGVGYRKRGTEAFDVILPTNRYSFADPFVFQYHGKTALFVELMDYYYGWGTIGVFEIHNCHPGSCKEIIKENNHMSFPNIFMHDDELYIIPETYSAGNVHLYHCIDFPYNWERVDTLIEGVRLVDHAVYCSEDTFVVSYDLDEKKSRVFVLNWDSMKLVEVFPKGHYSNERPGGTFYFEGNILHRVIQDCVDFYGDYLKIYKVDKLSENNFDETLQKEIRISDLRFNSRIHFEHVHQYSVSDEYEVVDVFFNKFCISKLFRYLCRRIFYHDRSKRYFC